ncbi:MAG: TetR/AcrR family transcriptional regulator [Bacteroidota bacterium]
MAQIKIMLNVSEQLFLRDPQQTKLGKRIVRNGIILIDEIGFECFTFKKLASKIKSTEASIYRYFENKHFFFVYLVNWYWEWTSFRISFNTMNMNSPKEKLRQVIHTIVDTSQKRASIDFVDTDILHRIVVTEGTKAYHGKDVDAENKMGFFLSYKALCKKIANIMLEIREDYPYPKALASTLVETANNNIYFAEHLPRLTDIEFSTNFHADIEKMLENMIFSVLEVSVPQGSGRADNDENISSEIRL